MRHDSRVPLTVEQAKRRLQGISENLEDAYTLLSGYEWRQIEDDLPMKAALHEARTKTREGFSIASLAQQRLAELAKKAKNA
jgi:hypothetical protein